MTQLTLLRNAAFTTVLIIVIVIAGAEQYGMSVSRAQTAPLAVSDLVKTAEEAKVKVTEKLGGIDGLSPELVLSRVDAWFERNIGIGLKKMINAFANFMALLFEELAKVLSYIAYFFRKIPAGIF